MSYLIGSADEFTVVRIDMAVTTPDDANLGAVPGPGLSSGQAMTNVIAMITGGSMASITIRNLDDALKRKLRLRAAHRNRSMEDEARDILRTALAQEPAETRSLADAIRELVEPLGGVELELPPRGPVREPPDFK
jgi:plasmid stability protein